MVKSEVMQALVNVLKKHPEGISDSKLDEELPDINVADRAEAVNFLLQKNSLQLLRQRNALLYRFVDTKDSSKLRGLSSEDMLIYQIIQNSGNKGIWTRDMKNKSNLPQVQITKILKNLENRQLIKSVKAVGGGNKKVYMLFELEPSKELTGGAWYSDQEFDSEFISILRKQCLQYILSHHPVGLEEVAEAIRRSGITKEELRIEDYTQLLNTLVLDGEVEKITSTGTAKDSNFSIGAVYFRPARKKLSNSSPFTSVPCGICPVISDCCDGGLISPQTCMYFQQWLDF